MLEPPGSLDAVRLVRGTMPLAYRYTAGIAGERFFRALAGRGVFLATTCEACGVTYCPARSFCERCFAELGVAAEVEVGPVGRLVSVTTVRIGLDGRPLAQPVPIGLIRLDGADTCLVHRLSAAGLAIGTAVEAVLRPPAQRTGCLDDVVAFRPVDGAGGPP